MLPQKYGVEKTAVFVISIIILIFILAGLSLAATQNEYDNFNYLPIVVQSTSVVFASPTPPPSPTIPIVVTQTPTSTPAYTPVWSLDPEELVMHTLEMNEQHYWAYANEIANNHLTIQLAATDNLDAGINITDPLGNQLIMQNDVGAGQIEIVYDLEITELGDYLITVYGADDAAGQYGMMVLDDYSYSFTFDNISYNIPVDVTFSPNSERLYFFTGSENDVISITAVPDSNSDIGFEFIGPNANPLVYVDGYFAGGTEQLTDYQLNSSGLYVVWLYGRSHTNITVNLLLSK
jgi:hypothetical protein